MDEAGQTGANLLDPSQPVFTLASVDLGDMEAADLVGGAGVELHFVNARRRPTGRARIVELLNALPSGRVKALAIHKPFMVTCKMIDLLVEPLVHEAGLDGYADGSLPALANLWHFTCEALIEPSALPDMQRLFVVAVRDCSPATLDAFYLRVGEAIACSTEELPAMREMWQDSRIHFAALAEKQALPVLDPGVPAAQGLIYQWARTYPDGFQVRHDERNELKDWIEHFTHYFDAGRKPAEFKFLDGATIRLPIPVTAFGTASSEEHPAIQIADVVASAATYLLRSRLAGDTDDPFAEELAATPLLSFVCAEGSVWPNRDFLASPVRAAPSGEFDRMTRWLDDSREGRPTVKRRQPRRNEACPCGSGRKYKKCHGDSSAG